MAINPSVQLQIENAIAAALGEAGFAAPLDRGDTGEYSVERMPAYNLALLSFANGYTDRDTDHDGLSVRATWGVFCYAKGGNGITAAEALDPLLVWAHQQLSDSTFGGLATGTRLQGGKLNWNQKDGNDTIEAVLTVEVEFDVTRGDPSQNYNE